MPLESKVRTYAASEKLDAAQVTFVYTMFHHLGDFVVMSGLLQKFDSLQAEFESLVAHQNSAHIPLFLGKTQGRFFNIATVGGLWSLIRKLRRQKKDGRIIFGLPMAPGSIQAFVFFWVLKKLGALTYIVDFNLNNADILTPPRKRYIFDRHLAQAAEIMKRPEWLNDLSMPLALGYSNIHKDNSEIRVGFYPESARAWLPEFKWPDNCWIELLNLICQNPDCKIVLIGRDKTLPDMERTFRPSLPEEKQGQLISLACSTVPELVDAIKSLDFIITVNTSALHLAHALKIPLVALSGSSVEMWLPVGNHVHIVQDTSAALPPSDKYWHDPFQPSLQRIPVQAVYAAFLDHFKKFSVHS